MELSFRDPHVLWLLALLPMLAYLAYRERVRRPALLHPAVGLFLRPPVGSVKDGRRGSRGFRRRLLPMLPILQLSAVGLVVIALSRPQTSDARRRDLSVEGIDIVIALDISTSMEAADFRPNNRLHVAKQVLAEFLTGRVNDRIGLVIFSGAAYTQAPLTLDYGALKEVVAQLRTRVLEDGTAIGDALAVSLNRLRESDAKSRVVVLITDGDNNAGKISPLDAADAAASLKIPIFTILVGKGGKVPFPAGTDLFGNTAWRHMEIPINPELLQEISARTGAEYYRATDSASLKKGLQEVLDALDRSQLLEGGAAPHHQERFLPFLLAGFFLAAIELVLRHTWLRVLP